MIRGFWPGKNGFWCKGRLIKGADWYKSLVTCLVILTSSLLLFLFPCEYLYIQGLYSPLILTLIVSILTLRELFMTATTDPGYIPKQVMPFASKYAQDLNEHISRPKPVLYLLRSTMAKLKFCQTCMLFRPPRCSHCSVCDLCVEGFDHHCPWIGNCIGKRNYYHFIGFLISSTALCILGLILCVYHIYLEHNNFQYKIVVSIIIAVYAFFILIFLISLLIFHVYLVGVGLTTNEKIKGIWGHNSMNPFNQIGFWNNVKNKYSEAKSKSQFNVKDNFSIYNDDIDPNYLHRKVHVYKSLHNLSHDAEELTNNAIIKKIDALKLN